MRADSSIELMSTSDLNSESEVIVFLRDNGCEVWTRGWPDLLVRNASGRIFGLELKAKSDSLRPSQRSMIAALHDHSDLCIEVRKYDCVADLITDSDVGHESVAWGGSRRWTGTEIGDLVTANSEEAYHEGYAEGFDDAASMALGETLGRLLMEHGRRFIEAMAAKSYLESGRQNDPELADDVRAWTAAVDAEKAA